MLKHIVSVSVIAAVLSSAPALATSATQTDLGAQSVDRAKTLDTTIQSIATKVGQGDATAQMFTDMARAVEADTSLTPHNGALGAHALSMKMLNENGTLTPVRVKRFGLWVFDARFEAAFRHLHEKIQKRKATEEDFNRLAMAMVAQALSASGVELDMRRNQRRLQGIVDALKAKYFADELPPEDLDDFQSQIAQMRIELVMNDMQNMAGSEQLAAMDVQHLKQVVGQCAGATGANKKRLTDAIAKLEVQISKGETVTAAQFTELRTSITTQVQEASAKK